MNIKDIRKSALYKELMKTPGVELMQIEYELQAAATTTAVMWDVRHVCSAIIWSETPQGFHFWAALDAATVVL